MITKETPTKEVETELKNAIVEFNKINYNENLKDYNYLENRKRNLEDILLIRKK